MQISNSIQSEQGRNVPRIPIARGCRPRSVSGPSYWCSRCEFLVLKPEPEDGFCEHCGAKIGICK